MRFVFAQGSNRATAHSKAFAEQTHENRGRVPRFSYFWREKMSVWELSDDSCSAFVRTQIVGQTKFFDSLEKYVCPKERNMIY